MRYGLLASLAVGLIAVGIGVLQPTFVSGQVKDKKPPLKDGKDKKDKVDPKDNPGSAEFKEPKEVLGKSFDYWKGKIHSDDQSEREIAIKNILFFGPNKAYEAVPDIIDEVKSHKGNANVDLSVRINGIQALHTIFRYKKPSHAKFYLETGRAQSEKEAVMMADKEAKLMEKYVNETFAICKTNLKKDQQVILRMQTMKGMPMLGPKAREAIDDIVLIVTKDAISWEMRKEAIPVLVALASPEVPGGAPNPAALPALSLAASSKNEKSALVRQTALQGIAALGEHVPVDIVRALDDPALPVRLTALQCLASMSQKWEAAAKAGDGQGNVDKKSAEAKIRDYLLRENDKALNMWAHAAIMTIHKKVTKAEIEPIRKRISDKDTALRLLALQIIGMIGPEAKDFVYSDVRDLFNDPEISVGVAAIKACVAMHAVEVKPYLKQIYDNPKANDALHFAAAEALDAFEGFEKVQQDKEKNEKKDKK